MAEPASTVASCSETTVEEKSSMPLEIVFGIDIGTSPCCVSVWNGSKVELFENAINEMIERSCETFNEHEATIFKMKHLIDLIDRMTVIL